MPFPFARALAVLLAVLAVPSVAEAHWPGSGVDRDVPAWLTPAALTAGATSRQAAPAATADVAVPRAACGPGGLPETALQGEVPRADRESGRSRQGYRCNLERVGGFQGEGASWVNASYRDCAYMATHVPNTGGSPGVQVIDVADPSAPKRVGNLTSPAMLGTWETLKVQEDRGLLVGIAATSTPGQGAGFVDIYDIATDCRHPRLLNSLAETSLSMPIATLGHESALSPDGRTLWSTNAYLGLIAAINISDPRNPALLYTGRTGVSNHGMGFSPDGNRLYLAQAGKLGSGALLTNLPDDLISPEGLQIFDVSQIQARRRLPQIRELSHLYWTDGAAGQHNIYVRYGTHPYVVNVAELFSGAARIIDIADETRPAIVSKLKLEIQLPAREALRKADTSTPALFGYDAHYCTADREQDPTALACGYFASGIRVFDIRDPRAPKEIAYFNPPARPDDRAKLTGSEHAGIPSDLRTDWCSSPPRFVPGGLWVTCQDNGFLTLRFTNGAYPLPAGAAGDLGLPPATRCASRRRFLIRLPTRLRSATVTVNGKRVRTLQGRRLRALVDLRGLPKGTVRVRVTGTTAAGRRVTQERVYRTCAGARAR